MDTINTNKGIINLQSQREDVRRSAMNLSATRQVREAVRQGILANSLATTRAVNQGAGLGSSSILGARAQIASSSAGNVLATRQAQQAGNTLFDLNRNITGNYLAAQDRSLGYLQQRQGIEAQQRGIQQQVFNLGGQSSQLSSDIAGYQGSAALGAGLSGIGGLLLGNASSISSNLQSFPGLFGSGINSTGTIGGTNPFGSSATYIS